ncbi:efflux RND transporter periplasmic adaptor subunit [Mesosutterella sp. AGMB02718]|uniref:Efflux RND transporter periplasmic adaptor subunit n=1 Tax=Mesosutterella faecium TaxID=2925194 RepID=A0ABT7IJ59_9BURK|nr:efflux RND transporter periplasmic adaptor subunit [Mesosutterella sp. AGMB02718]MDL2058409.1 efflux RND transporter periplasmic adaptor subunit [Mesosutterella sp. AGMB02718]
MPTPTEKETSQTLPERPDERTARRRRSRILGAVAAAAGLALIGFIVWGVWLASHPKAPPLQGQMDATTIDVAAKVPGRLETVNVKEGDQVSKGQVIATLYVPEIEAKVRQAEAYEKARQAQESLAQEGARPQEIQAAKAQYERAQAAEELAQKTYERISRLYREGFVPAQRLDEVTANLKAARKQSQAAREQWSIAQTGARRQEKQAAAALAAQAAGTVAEAKSYAEEAKIVSPISGEVSRVLLREGEVAPQGFAVVTVVNLNDQWASFNLREDELKDLRMGSVIRVKIPAIGGGAHDFKIYFINPKADYANWRATRQNSGYDLRTFEVRARPVSPVEGLRPGMTALIER